MIILVVRKIVSQHASQKKQLKIALQKAEESNSLSQSFDTEIKPSPSKEKITSPEQDKTETSSSQQEKKEQVEKEVKRLIKQADIHVSQKDWIDAEKFLIQALAYDEKDKEALKRIAEVYLTLESYSRSIFFLDQYFDYHGVCPTTASHYALAHFYSKDFNTAITYFSKAIDIEPENDVRYANLGEVFITLENYEDAVKCYTEALKIAPRNIEYHRSITDALRLSNSFTDAKQWYQKILTLSPYDGEAQKQLEKLEALGF